MKSYINTHSLSFTRHPLSLCLSLITSFSLSHSLPPLSLSSSNPFPPSPSLSLSLFLPCSHWTVESQPMVPATPLARRGSPWIDLETLLFVSDIPKQCVFDVHVWFCCFTLICHLLSMLLHTNQWISPSPLGCMLQVTYMCRRICDYIQYSPS